MKSTLTSLLLLVLFTFVYSQESEKQAIVVYEKVYLHTDRELYSPGDTIWFKAYLVGGVSHKLLPGFKNMYVQLISQSGEVISNRLLLSFYGESFGDITLNDTLPEGQYILRARTKYLENFGEESFFHKRIWVNKPKSSMELDLQNEEAPTEIEAMFFPEGGNLVYNAANHVAFKVIGADGRGIESSGVVVNQNNDTITRFSTCFLGMGKFTLMPKEGESYYAIIDNYPKSKQELSNILKGGLALNFKDIGKEVLFTISRDFKETGDKTIFLEATHKGVHLFQEKITIEGFSGAIRIGKNQFPLGISKITLFDSNSNILAQRLVFIDVDYGNTVKVETGKEEYSTREKVNLSLEPIHVTNDSVTSTLSVSVVSEDYLSATGMSQNIKSYLLLDSELKGAIESPALYFFDEEKITAAEKLDLLMMVQGWRSYYWDEIVKKAPENLTGWDDAGINISGQVKSLFRNREVDGGKVTLTSISPRLMVEETKTDSLGYFSFERLFLGDSSEIMITAANEKGRKQVEVITDSLLGYETKVDTFLINQNLTGIGIPLKYYREIYLQQLAERKYVFEEGGIVLDEVTVTAKITDEDVFELIKPFYNFFPDNTYLITKEDYQYETVRGFIDKKIGSKYLDVYNMFFHPKIYYILNNDIHSAIINYHEDKNYIIESIAIENIYRIDLIKNGGPYVPEIYHVYQKKNQKDFSHNRNNKNYIHINGFQPPNKFYSPKYTLENINDKLPDYRPTLYWSPEVAVKDGKANLEFFTCDNLSNYIVIVEGISKNGKICYGTGRFSVTGRYN
ncbi:MAG: hypothetical protein JW833_09895 [Prolixibacteraceae bacterium]|nr:hypothetical protein [Prolixibacteraceae bacterium]